MSVWRSGLLGRLGHRRLAAAAMGLGTSQPVSSSVTLSEAKLIQGMIDENCVMIFSKTTCGFCRMAKNVFTDMDIPYKALELNTIQGGDRIAKVLTDMTGSTTVPQVFVNGQCLGGGTETKALYQQGRLHEMVSKCGPRLTS